MDVVCYYADLGRPYLPLLQNLCASAKASIPYCRTVLLTPTPTDELTKLFEVVVCLTRKADISNLCLERVRAMASWAAVTERRAAYADPDIVFRRPPPFDGSFDIGLLWRKTKVDQPVNTGVILSEPGNKLFWAHYTAIAVNLPSSLYAWFCDQLAFALMTGVCRKSDDRFNIDGSRIWLMDAKRHCYKPNNVTDEAWALHYKGATKGEGWDQIFTSHKENQSGAQRGLIRHGDGMSSAVSV